MKCQGRRTSKASSKNTWVRSVF